MRRRSGFVWGSDEPREPGRDVTGRFRPRPNLNRSAQKPLRTAPADGPGGIARFGRRIADRRPRLPRGHGCFPSSLNVESGRRSQQPTSGRVALGVPVSSGEGRDHSIRDLSYAAVCMSSRIDLFASNQAASSPGLGMMRPASMMVAASASSILMTRFRSGCPASRDQAADRDFNSPWRVSSVRPARTMALMSVPFSRTAPPR